jgi:hypothetical protein
VVTEARSDSDQITHAEAVFNFHISRYYYRSFQLSCGVKLVFFIFNQIVERITKIYKQHKQIICVVI